MMHWLTAKDCWETITEFPSSDPLELGAFCKARFGYDLGPKTRLCRHINVMYNDELTQGCVRIIIWF